MKVCKLTVKDHEGKETVFENVSKYTHTHKGLEIKYEDKPTDIVPKEKIKHAYVGLPTNENKIRSLNS